MNKPTVSPVHHMTEHIWLEVVCVCEWVCLVLSRMSGGLWLCRCCSFMSVTGIIDTPTHRQAGSWADCPHVAADTLMYQWYTLIHLEFRAPCMSLGQSFGLRVCPSLSVCIFFVMTPSLKMIHCHLGATNPSWSLALMRLSVFCSNLSSSLLLFQVTDVILSFWWSLEFRQHGSQPESRSVCLFSLILPHLLWPLRAAEFGHVVKMIILLSDIGCLFEKCVDVCVSLSGGNEPTELCVCVCVCSVLHRSGCLFEKCVCVCVCGCVWLRVASCVCVWLCVCVFAGACVCLYLHVVLWLC